MAESANVPGAQVITFNSDQWHMVQRFVKEVRLDLDSTFISAVSQLGLRLDGDLKTELKPGSSAWTVVDKLTTAAGAFGGSVLTQFTTLSDKWDAFIEALESGERIFENHNDLATTSAQDLLTEEPGLAPGG